MYIKSITLEGFKSYGNRTEIYDFDPQFNAITGLNGSGKSNILDGICFLLGISNLSQVRALNMQELVYKNGLAGVTRATVSIVFDNSEPKKSPVGYEHYNEIKVTRQVVIGGKSKYLINGYNSQNNRVHDLFNSVQLNINNPHFLIMQGRITKVLNMKPKEILSMIEEAAGTRLYESKKSDALKIIQKKDLKLKEINEILDEQITPNLSKLKSERSTYLEYQKIQRELDHLFKLTTAYKFVQAEKFLTTCDEKLTSVAEKKADLETLIETSNAKINKHMEEVERLRLSSDSVVHALEIETVALRNLEKEGAKLASSYDSICASKQMEKRKIDRIQKGIATDKKKLEKMALGGNVQEEFDALRAEDERCKQALEAAQARFEAISIGQFTTITEEHGGGGGDHKAVSATLEQLIIDLKARIAGAQTQLKTADMKIKHHTSELKTKIELMKKTEKQDSDDSLNVSKYEKEVTSLGYEMSRLKYKDGSIEALDESLSATKNEVKALQSSLDRATARYPWLDFQYSDPERGFDRSLVHGVVAKLFRVNNAEKYCVALDAAAGGKLMHVAVQTAEVGGKILSHGKLSRRTNLCPLDKVIPNVIPLAVLKKARSIVGQHSVDRAIDLVSFSEEVRPAIEFSLGNVLVCKDLDVANKLAFNPSIARMCVTLDGDKVNPVGEISGGAPNKSGSILAHIHAMWGLQDSWKEKFDCVKVLQEQRDQLCRVASKFNELKSRHELKERELQMIKNRIQYTEHFKLKQEIDELKAAIATVEAGVVSSKKIESEGALKLKELEFKVKNAKTLIEKEFKESEAELKKCKIKAENSRKKWADKEAQEATVLLQTSELKKTMQDADEQVKQSMGIIDGFDVELEKLSEVQCRNKAAVNECKEKVKLEEDKNASFDRIINVETKEIEKLRKKVENNKLEIQSLTHEVSDAKARLEEANRSVQSMLRNCVWITEDRKFFGVPNTVYDFKATDPMEADRRLRKLEETKGKMEKTVNMRAMNMLGKTEEQYNELLKKKHTVEMDKKKINHLIQELDVKKRDEIRSASDKVNKDFGSIFSTLLPGACAKLVAPENQDVLDGVEFKIGFGNVWKESLNELSGGQRSLVALSLILSLLLFNPAPLYILDEVDAALDLSHTQNIGRMLKLHFKHSQFIVVSLKEGMFNNANVLFRTKFVDGMSTVTRTVQTQSKK